MLPGVINSTDSAIRSAAFGWLTEQVDLHGDVLPRDVLAEGFEVRGERVTLIGPSGGPILLVEVCYAEFELHA